MNALCLVRHGIAGERGPAWPDDRLRPLTPEGIRRMTEGAAGLALICEPGAILTSPLVRARQTAEILAAALPGQRLITSDALANGDHAALLNDAERAGGDVVFAVGHEPHISMAASWLLTGDESEVPFDVKKGAAILLRFAGVAGPGAAYLDWMLQPRILRALGNSSAKSKP